MYLIYHPERKKVPVGKYMIYCDKFGNNEDPYLWNNKFLHSYCHITQMKNEEGQINFWISGDIYPNFTKLFCDCVFVIKEKLYWSNSNRISKTDSIVDNIRTFDYHYKWVNPPFNAHHFTKRRRYTLKADAIKSFQPQNSRGELIDILPFLNKSGISTDELINTITSKRGSHPTRLENNIGLKLYDFLLQSASIKLYGKQIANLFQYISDNRNNQSNCKKKYSQTC